MRVELDLLVHTNRLPGNRVWCGLHSCCRFPCGVINKHKTLMPSEEPALPSNVVVPSDAVRL